MTSPTNSPPDTDEPKSFMAKLDLSVHKLTGGALASVTAAVAASYLGVGGTLTGAALGSVLSSVAATFYATSLQSAGSKIRAPRTVRSNVQRTSPYPSQQPSSQQLSSQQYRPRRAQQRSMWQPVAVMTGFAFMIAMGAIFGTELFLGHPISDAQQAGTTIERLVDPAPPVKKPVRDKKTAPEPTSTTTSPAEGTASPSDSATKDAEETTGTSSTTKSSTDGDGEKNRDEEKPSNSSDAEGSREKTRTTSDDSAPEPTPTAEPGQDGAADQGGDAAGDAGADEKNKDQAATKDPAA